jgi:hypothetical protein
MAVKVHETDAPLADGEVVWFWHLDADAKLSGAIRAATATKSPIAGKSAKEAVKPLRRECRIVAQPVATMLVCFLKFCTRGCGCELRARHFLRPLYRRVRFVQQPRARSRRGSAEACFVLFEN